MKTTIKTLIATTFATLVLTTSAFSAPALEKNSKSVEIATVKTFKRIKVSGNVEITLIQKSNIDVQYAYDNYGTAKVIQKGDLLNITSADNNLTKLVIYVDDLYRIEATDHVVIKTEGKLNTQFLQIFLKGNAHAEIKTNTQGLYTVLSDNADLKLSGATELHTLAMGNQQTLTMDKFAALKTKFIDNSTLAKNISLALAR